MENPSGYLGNILQNSSKRHNYRDAAALVALSLTACIIHSASPPATAQAKAKAKEQAQTQTKAAKPLSASEIKKFEQEAEFLTNHRNSREVVRMASEALEKNPNNPVILMIRGRAYLAMRRRELAIADFTASLKVRPIADSYRERAYAYKLMGQAQRCLEDWQAAAKLEPNAQNVMEVANAQINLGDISAGIEGCKKALTMLNTIEPKHRARVELHISEKLGQAYLGLNEPAKALGPFTKAVQLVPGYAEAKKKENSASPLATAKKYPDGNLRRGEALEKLGRLREAIVEYEVAVKARPKSFDYRRSLLRAYRKSGHNDKALALVNQLLIEDDSPDLFYKRADIYKKIGKNDLAKIDEERARKIETGIMGSIKPQ